MAQPKPPAKETFREEVFRLVNRPGALRVYIDRMIPFLTGPVMDSFTPREAHPGAMLVVSGRNFAAKREDNTVTAGGRPALVVAATSTELKVLTSTDAVTGPVRVKVGTRSSTAPYDLVTLSYPRPGSEDDGPPIYFAGAGQGQPGDLPSTGTLNLLVVLVNPTDRIPANPTAAHTAVDNAWQSVHTFYDQASYGDLDVVPALTTNWHTLSGTFNDYVTVQKDSSANWVGDAPNFWYNQLDRIMAEAAQAAVDEGIDLNDFQAIACVMNLNNTFVRAWGGSSSSNFAYGSINITTNHDLNRIWINESADWGRCAHELGHNLVSAPSGLSANPGAATLGEDVYQTGLIDPSVSTAHQFEMMGSHDTHPLFSAYYIDQLKYYQTSNIREVQWDRNPFNQDFDLVAHGLAENSAAGRHHLLKIRVTNGLYYNVEVRQRPGPTTQIFDDSIPVDGAPQQGGVVVTKVLTDTVNMNQQLRFITLLHDPVVLRQGDTAVDPARALKITVLNDHVVDRPLVCRVRVEWAQSIGDDPNGRFDLRVDPWDSGWQTPDIWIDRIPYGSFDQPNDAEGRPLGNGDKPRPKEVNRLYARIHNDGTDPANNVQVTFYTVEPPGVGDNGNWAPLKTVPVPTISSNGHVDVPTNWTPVVGKHTCLKAYAGQQLGEITGGNNSAQENVGEFEAPASSVPDPVLMPVAVRNPLKHRTMVIVRVTGVPEGFTVHFPHAWVWLDGLEERNLTLTVIPTMDYAMYQRKEIPRAEIRVLGLIPRTYSRKVEPGVFPGSRMLAIGGITARITPKKRVTIALQEDREHGQSRIAVTGRITPRLAGEHIRADMTDPHGRLGVVATNTDAQGRFSAQFDLTREPSLTAKAGKKQKLVPGVYLLQAFVVNSPHAAEAASKVLRINRKAAAAARA